MSSLLVRVALIFFATTAAVITVLMLVVNYQVSAHFTHYLNMAGMHHMMMERGSMPMMGAAETGFLASLKHSLWIVTGILLAVGAAVSYYLARSITTPVIKLNQAVHKVTAGDLTAAVAVDRRDEVGQLAAAFNAMTAGLKTNALLRQRFLAGVAHELRTPLTIIKANLEGIADGVIVPDQEQIRSLTDEIDRMTKLVEDLRSLSLLEAGQLTPEFETVDVGRVLGQVVAKSKALADEKKIDLRLKEAAGAIYGRADAGMLYQMTYNLVINAIKYTAPAGRVIISAGQTDDRIEISVADTGVGIAAEEREHIFDYFYRVDPSRSKQSGGTGLGLALVRQMAGAHGGKVRVDSVVGKGSTFTLVLPKAQEKGAAFS